MSLFSQIANDTPMDCLPLTPGCSTVQTADIQKCICTRPTQYDHTGIVCLYFLLSGSGTVQIAGQEYAIRKGCLSILDEAASLYIEPTAPVVLYRCSFAGELFCLAGKLSLAALAEKEELAYFFAHRPVSLSCVQIPAEAFERFRRCFDRLFTEAEHPGGGYMVHFRLQVTEILTRAAELNHTARAPALYSTEDERSVGLILQYIHDNYSDKCTYDELAAMVHLSRSKLFSLFKAQTGKTIGEYILTLRLQRACALLAETDHTVYDIMLEVGYNDMKLFCRRFREHTGTTPTEYRKKYR